jgi:hypothetical protein
VLPDLKRDAFVGHRLVRELEDVACEHSEGLAASVPGFAAALAF